MDKKHFVRLTKPTPEIARALHRWQNDPALVPFIRPNKTKEDLAKIRPITVDWLHQRMKTHHIYLMYRHGQLVGEMNFQVDPEHLHKQVPGTAWIGIIIGEPEARGIGLGYQAMRYLEGRIEAEGLKRIELGVFEFNEAALTLYRKLGYREFARIEDFTYWQGRLWQDIRMEKYLKSPPANG